MDGRRDLLRHFLSTLAYRVHKAIDGPPPGFESFTAGSGVRTPLELMHHINRLLQYSHTRFRPEEHSPQAPLPTWAEAVRTFYRGLRTLDRDLEHLPLQAEAGGRVVTEEALLQGPLADAMTHAGQLALLRRLAGGALPAESFIEAEIHPGRFRGDPGE